MLQQKDIAEKLGIAKSTVSMWETGDRKPNVIMLKKLSELLGCTTDELLECVPKNELVNGQTES